MQVKILKGTNQIGGVFTEISSKEAKIIIDFGDDLDDPKTKRLPVIERTNHRHTNIQFYRYKSSSSRPRRTNK